MTAIIETEKLTKSYGAHRGIVDLDLEVDEGEAFGFLGPNGAGKTTTLRALSGMVSTRGRVRFDGEDVTGRKTDAMARLGVAHVPEGRGTFETLTVEENLRVGAYTRRDGGAVKEDLRRCYGWFPRLEERRTQQAGSLSGGEQQMVALARGLMLRPRLLMLDEPSLGLSPLLTRELFSRLGDIAREEGMTVLVVEQNANLALDFADYAYVLESGRIVLSGESAQVRDDEGVRRSYLRG
jgi:branched-chain amino acid transport system ATP-binding protein